jgi:hypothetical protein
MVPTCKYGKLGRLAVNKAHLRSLPRLATFMSSALAPPPNVVNYTGGITSWGMMLNDTLGDCTAATVGHLRMAYTVSSHGKPIVTSDADILAAYAATSGYNPATGGGDDGAACVDVLNYWQTTGIGGNKIVGYVAIDPTNVYEVKQAIYLFGGVYAGINLPQSAENETDAGQPWDLQWWSPNLGGHAIPYITFGPDGVEAITWGKVQPATWSCVTHQTDELYAIISQEFLCDSGKSPAGLDVVGMQQACQILRAA